MKQDNRFALLGFVGGIALIAIVGWLARPYWMVGNTPRSTPMRMNDRPEAQTTPADRPPRQWHPSPVNPNRRRVAVLPHYRSSDHLADVAMPLAHLPAIRLPDDPSPIWMPTASLPPEMSPAAELRSAQLVNIAMPLAKLPVIRIPDDPSPIWLPTAKLPADMSREPQFVMSLCTDQQGKIWIGTEDRGICRYDPDAPEREQYHWFTTEDGLGDDNGYAVACDRLGRIWAGHLNHGVSVYNGQKWQCYETVGGLSRPDTLSGPLGERVFAIAVCAVDGDVWIATNCGLSRYSEKQDTWSYYTRAEGLPSDQAQSLAFDKDGNLYVGTQCDGVAMADARDDYKTWRVVTGPDKMPTTPTGEGLPTNLINSMLVAKDGAVYAATTTGLAYSHDKGKTWRYWRGQDYADKVRGLYGGPPKGWHEEPGAILAEDYVTCLTEGDDGSLWIGYRRCGWQRIDPKNGRNIAKAEGAEAGYFVTSMLVNGEHAVIGTYGDASFNLSGRLIDGQKISPSAPAPPSDIPLSMLHDMQYLPSSAQPLTHSRLADIVQHVQATPHQPAIAAFVGDDWTTQGNWVGRYGRQYAILCAANSPYDEVFYTAINAPYAVRGQLGPHHTADDALRHWLSQEHTDNSKTLYDPELGYSRQTEWDDHGENYESTYQGPDLWITVYVPKGRQRVSLYFMNKDGHARKTRSRDYTVEIKAFNQDLRVADAAPSLAHARVEQFWGGVYKQFIVCLTVIFG